MERTYVNQKKPRAGGTPTCLQTYRPTDLQTYSRTHAWSRRFLILGTLVLGLFAMTRTALAQTTTQHRVIHLWVDPHHGVDTNLPSRTGAAELNPTTWGVPPSTNACPSTPQIFPTQPVDVLLSNGLPLLNAPWPFKTIRAALSYIPTLPSTSTSNPNIKWDYAIIHLLPGLYARETAYGVAGTPNPDNGLIPNGESFPIDIPDRVSIQGTNALNTLIDLGPANADFSAIPAAGGPAFRFGAVSTSTGTGSFIANVSIMGAYPYLPGTVSKQPNRCAAIYLAPSYAAHPTIANCFLFGNGIGVLIDSNPIDGSAQLHHGTTLINNTIAMNYMGIWSGPATTSFAGTRKAFSQLILINNIFDASLDPAKSYPRNWITNALFGTGIVGSLPQCFEGVDQTDLQVSTGSGNQDYNAYESGYFNSTASHGVVGLPAVQVRGTPFTAPGIDILPWTGGVPGQLQPTKKRGILYVRDLLANGSFIAASSFDMSPHDFRLAPSVAPSVLSTSSNIAPGNSAAGGAANPLVNRGWYAQISPGTPLNMANGQQLTRNPGYLDLVDTASQQTWPYDLWKHDAEGSGNDRVHQHNTSIYPLAPVAVGGIDIGADELGQLLGGGYRYGTTNLMALTGSQTNNNLPAGINDMDNKYLWFLGVPDSQIGNVQKNTLRPFYRRIDHLANPPAAYKFTLLGNTLWDVPWFDKWTWDSATYYIPYLTDTAPHLLGDAHPWWNLGVPGVNSNPIWQECHPNYNFWLFVTPQDSIIHPNGVYLGDPRNPPAFRFLDGTWTGSASSATSLILPFGQSVPLRTPFSSGLTSYDNWCRAHTGTIANKYETFLQTFTGSGINGLGSNAYTSMRYALEHFTRPPWTGNLTDTNIQSFRVIVEKP